MKKEKKSRLSTRTLCMLGMLLAVTVLLAIYGTFRIGNIIKVPTKFVGVFIAGALFGPLWSGTIGALGDILNCLIMPVGPWLPLLTLLEFVSGAIYGLLFFGWKEGKKNYFLRALVCVILQALLDIFVTPAVLCHYGYFGDYQVAIGIRLPATGVKIVLWALVLAAGYLYIPLFRKLIQQSGQRPKKTENNG